MRTLNDITHTQLCFRALALRAFRRAGLRHVPSIDMQRAIISRQGVKGENYTLRNARHYAKQINDPLKSPFSQRHTERGFKLLGKVGKDRPGEMITFELEAFVPPKAVPALKAALPLVVQLVGDGSLESGDSPRTAKMEGVELRVPCNMTDYSRLYAICRLLAVHGARVNRTCGLHVHLDVRDLSPHKRYADVKAEGTRLYSVLSTVGRYLVPPSRLNNRYCALTAPSTKDRYRVVNAEATAKHGTIEVRLHSGTVEADKARLWAELCLFFLRRPLTKSQKTALSAVHSAADALDWILKSDLPPTLKWWSAQRLEKFHPSAVTLPGAGSNTSEASE